MSRLLVVEDEANVRSIWVETLTAAGHTVDTAEDGVQAIKQLSSHHYDAVVFDLMLPRLGGLEAIKLIRRTEPYLPIMAVTGMQDPDIARTAREVGATEIVFKPIPLEELAERIHQLLEHSRDKDD